MQEYVDSVYSDSDDDEEPPSEESKRRAAEMRERMLMVHTSIYLKEF